jgi:single-stranded DNA-binding protein
MNKVILTGRLVSDDFKKFQSSKGIISLTFKIALIEKTNRTNFIDIVCFDKIANNITKYIKKGDLLEIEGKLNNSKYTTKDGKTIYKTEIIAKNITFSVKSKNNENNEQDENNDENILGFEYFDEDEE